MNVKTKLMTLLLALVALVAVTACNGEKPKKGQLKQGAMLYINISKGQLKAMDESTTKLNEEKLMTPEEIVRNALNFCIDDPDGLIDVLVGISDEQRDFTNNRIKMWGEQIIDRDGQLVEVFMKSKNVRICTGKYPDKDNFRNIIAYIPNKVMQEGWVKIKKAYDAGNYEEVYRLFQEVYTAIPITPSEYAKLREKGEN